MGWGELGRVCVRHSWGGGRMLDLVKCFGPLALLWETELT